MALQKQPPTTIPMTGSVDTKTHPHVLRPAEFIKLLNVDLHEPGAIGKRRAYERFAEDVIDGSTAPTSWDEATAYGGKNLAFADGAAYEYIDSAGKLVLLDSDAVLARGQIDQVDRTPFANTATSDYAYVNGYEVLLYSATDTTATMVFRDHATGAVLYVKNSEFAANAARAVAFGTTLMVVTVEDDDGTASVKAYFINTASLPTSVSMTTVISDADTTTIGALDVVANLASDHAVAVYRKKSAASVKVIEIDDSGAAGSSVTHASNPEMVAIHQVEGNSDFTIAWDDNSTGNIEVYGVTSSPFSLQSTHSIFTSVSPSHLVIGNGTTGTRSRVYWDDGSDTTYRECNGDGTTSASTLRLLLLHRLASKPFAQDSRNYITLANRGNSGASNPFDRTLIAMLVTEDAEVFEAVGWIMYELNKASTFNTGSSVSAVYLAPDGEFTFAATRSINIVRNDAESATYRASWQISERGGVDSKGTMYFPGGGLYAGESMQAIGFPYRPEITSLTAQVAGGSLTPSETYAYVAVYEYTDKTGQIHRSAPSTPVSVALGAGDGSVDVDTTTLMDRDSDSKIVLYRTQGNGTTFQRLTAGPTAAQSRASVSAVFTYTDAEADSTLADNPILYSNSGAQVENYPPPGTYVYMLHGNRLWAVDEDGNIAFSKELREGVAPAFNPGFTVSTRVIGEPPIALVSRDTHFVVFWPKSIGYVHGDGPNAAGAGGQFTVPQIIEGSPVGCSNVNSIVEMPKGIMFEDAALGIYLLPSGAGQVPIFVGARIEEERTGTIIGAELVKDREAVVFTQSDSKQLVYWYQQNRWSTNQIAPTSPVEAITATSVWNERLVLALDGGTLGRVRTDGFFRDTMRGPFITDYHRTITTGWISLEQMLRLARVWRFNLLGERVDDQTVVITLSRNFNDALSEVHTLATSNSEPLILRIHLVNQKLKSIKVQIKDSGGAGSYGATKWTAMQLEWGAKNRGPRVNRDNGDAG